MKRADSIRLAIVLWNGRIGGAETLSGEMARRLRDSGAAEATVVFVSGAEPLNERLDAAAVPHEVLGLARGRSVVRHPRRFAELVSRAGCDAALLVGCGFLPASLRAGGYRGAVVAVQHGAIIEPPHPMQRAKGLLSRVSGSLTTDAEVAVSDFVLRQMPRWHGPRRLRIYNGIDPDKFPLQAAGTADHVTVGFAGRLIPGKGADHAIAALAIARREIPVRMLIAGDGPELPRLRALAETLKVDDSVEFLGMVPDVLDLWTRCDLAIAPSDSRWIEACPMAVLEAMACGRPVIGTYNGGLPELIVPGQTGALVAMGDAKVLAQAVVDYARAPRVRRAHGIAARARCCEVFSIDRCLRSYLELFNATIAQ